MKLLWGLAIVILVIPFLSSAVLAMSSTNYQINWDSMNIGGEDTSSSTNYSIKDTLGQIVSGSNNSGSYSIVAGYRQAVTESPIMSFSLSTQSNSSQVTASSFDNANKQVTVSDDSGFSANDYIVVVQDEGSEGTSQKIAVGKVASKAANVITVDKWDGDNASISLDGSSDYVYKLSGDAAQLGTLTTSTMKTSTTRIEVTTNAGSGYTAYIKEDNDLSTGSASMTDVSDGTVSIGSEEYGIAMRGDDAASSNDIAITTSDTSVATNSSYVTENRVGIIYRSTISATTEAGSYSHVVTYTVVGNF